MQYWLRGLVRDGCIPKGAQSLRFEDYPDPEAVVASGDVYILTGPPEG